MEENIYIPIKPWYKRRFWLKVRRTDIMRLDPFKLSPAIHEFYVPWYAWPLEIIHILVFGKTEIS